MRLVLSQMKACRNKTIYELLSHETPKVIGLEVKGAYRICDIIINHFIK
jgi:hypothetical protein